MVEINMWGAKWCSQCEPMKLEMVELQNVFESPVGFTYTDVDDEVSSVTNPLPMGVTSLPYIEARVNNELVYNGGPISRRQIGKRLQKALEED